MSATALETLLQNADVWRGAGPSQASLPGIASGFAALDEILGGWPPDAVTELIPRREGVGELSLLLPALAALSRTGRWIAFVNPPHVPYAPALAAAGVDLARVVVIRAAGSIETLWAMEQSLRAGACGAVLGWPGFVTEQAIRRLQLAAETGRTPGFYFTACGALPRTSPVRYRLRIDAHPRGTQVEILKRRGGGVPAPLIVENALALPGLSSPAAGTVPAGRRAA
jgi:cell division inhibitor SulA